MLVYWLQGPQYSWWRHHGLLSPQEISLYSPGRYGWYHKCFKRNLFIDILSTFKRIVLRPILMISPYGTGNDLVSSGNKPLHDDVIKWKHFPRYWPFVRGIHRSPVNFHHKGQWHGALMIVYLRLNKRSSKQSWGWWFETPSHSLWRHCNIHLYNACSAMTTREQHVSYTTRLFIQQLVCIDALKLTKHQNSSLLAFCEGNHRRSVDSLTKSQLYRKCFHVMRPWFVV